MSQKLCAIEKLGHRRSGWRRRRRRRRRRPRPQNKKLLGKMSAVFELYAKFWVGMSKFIGEKNRQLIFVKNLTFVKGFLRIWSWIEKNLDFSTKKKKFKKISIFQKNRDLSKKSRFFKKIEICQKNRDFSKK